MIEEDDDLDMEEWMKLSDAEHDSLIAIGMKKYNKWYDGLTLKQQIKYNTRKALQGIMENKIRLRTPELCRYEFAVIIWKEGVRRNQRRLVKIRAWRTTGIYPGEA